MSCDIKTDKSECSNASLEEGEYLSDNLEEKFEDISEEEYLADDLEEKYEVISEEDLRHKSCIDHLLKRDVKQEVALDSSIEVKGGIKLEVCSTESLSPEDGYIDRSRNRAKKAGGLNRNKSLGGFDRYVNQRHRPFAPTHPVLEELKSINEYNPRYFELNPKQARFFVVKSYSEDDIHRSIKYGIWCSTELGNKRLDNAFRERESSAPIFLFFSVNGSGHFNGMGQMLSGVNHEASAGVWAQDKWKGQFEVKWIYVKDIPNARLRHIRLENNDNKPVTNSRDTQEVSLVRGKQLLEIFHNYKHATSIFDNFMLFEKRQEDEARKSKVKIGYKKEKFGF